MRIVCPDCRFEKDFPDDQIPADAEMATCPRCKSRFKFRSLTPEPAPEPLREPETATFEATDANDGVPFENWDKYEPFPSLVLTVRQVMLESPAFFSRMPTAAGYGRPILFYLIISLTQLFIRLLEVKYLGSGELLSGAVLGGREDLSVLVNWRMISLTMAISPLLFLGALGLYSALAHLLLSAFHAAGSGFQATFRVLAYGSAPSILAVIPFAGPAVSLVWSLAAIFIGLRYAHRTSFSRAGLSLLALVIIALGVISYLMNAAPPPPGMDMAQ